jgi:hypothetical protein
MTMTPQNFRKKYSNAGLLGVPLKSSSFNGPRMQVRGSINSVSQFNPSLREIVEKNYKKDSLQVNQISRGSIKDPDWYDSSSEEQSHGQQGPKSSFNMDQEGQESHGQQRSKSRHDDDQKSQA